MVGLGLVMGPIIGSALYSVLGFKGTFYVFGVFVLMIAVIMRFKLPERRPKSDATNINITEERLLEQQRVGNLDKDEIFKDEQDQK